MLQDDQVKSTFQQRRLAVISREWGVEPGGTSAQDKKAAKPKAKPKKAAKAPSKAKKATTKPKAKKAAAKKAPNTKGLHPDPQKFDSSKRMFSEIFLADLVREAAASMGVAHAELARRLECSGPRIPEILRSENITEALASRCFEALGVDLEIRMVKLGS